MSREAGFSRADVDTSLLADPKVVHLARQLRDPHLVATATCMYVGLVLASWKAGERVTLEDAAPAWFLEPVDKIRAALTAAELLDSEGRIPIHAWASWYEPAAERRRATVDRWTRANEKRRVSRGDSAATAQQPRGYIGEPQPTGPTGPTGQVLPIRSLRAASGSARGATTPARGVTAAPDEIEVDRV